MDLTAAQQDALIELLNIGFGRAAASLSQLTGHRVVLEVPARLHPSGRRAGAVAERSHQRRHRQRAPDILRSGRGRCAADPRSPAPGRLKQLLTDEPPLPLRVDASAREVLTEVGNILLNACLGTFGNILEVNVSFSLPHLNLETLRDVLESLLINREGMRYAMVVHAGFRLRDAEVTGYLVIVLSVASLDR